MSGIKDKGTIARSLAQLEKAGFVVRRTPREDRRAKAIYLTDRGRAFWRATEERVSSLMPDLTAAIDPGKLATCLEVLSSLYDRLHEEALVLEPSEHD